MSCTVLWKCMTGCRPSRSHQTCSICHGPIHAPENPQCQGVIPDADGAVTPPPLPPSVENICKVRWDAHPWRKEDSVPSEASVEVYVCRFTTNNEQMWTKNPRILVVGLLGGPTWHPNPERDYFSVSQQFTEWLKYESLIITHDLPLILCHDLSSSSEPDLSG